MRIQKLRLEGFRSYREAVEVADLDRVNVFLGENAAGKSSLLDAVDYALSGTCRGTDQGGRGAERLISRSMDGKPAAKTFKIVLTTAQGEVVRGPGAGPNSKYQDTVNQLIGPRKGRNTQALEVALQPGLFLELPPAEQRALLLAIVGGDIDKEHVLKELGDAAQHLPRGALDSLAMLDQAEQSLRLRRPQIKRALDELVVAAPPVLTVRLPDGMDPAQVLETSKAELAQFNEQRYEITTRTRARSMAAAGAKARREAVEKKKAEAQSLLARMMSVEEVRAKVEALTAQVEEASRKDSAAKQKQGELKQRVAATERIVTALKPLLDVGEKLGLCKTCAPKLAKLCKQHEEELAKLKASLRPGPETKGGIKEVERQLEELDQVYEMIRDKQAQLQAIDAEIAALPAEAEAAQDPEEAETLAGLEKTIQSGNRYIDEIQKLLYSQEQAESVKGRRLALETELAALEVLIKRLGAGGDLRSSILGPGAANFEKEVNELLDKVAWGKCRIRVDAERWGIDYRPAEHGVPVPADMLSTSERYRLSLALAAVIARRAGLGLLCLDGADVLVGAHKAALAQVLEAAGLEQAIVCASTARPSAPPEMEGWRFYEVKQDGGQSTVARLSTS